MELHYLDFEFSDDDAGPGSFDAMASVWPERLPPLLAEVAAVLRWAHEAFGAPAAIDDGGEWDYALQALAEPDGPLPIAYDEAAAKVSLAPGGAGRITLTLTLGGSRAFCDALRDAFGLAP